MIIKILAKLRMKNNAIKLKLPIWLGSIPFTFLHLLPTVAIGVLKNNMSSMMGEEAGEASSLMSGLSISFFSCAWLSFVIGVFFFFFAIFYYGKLRKKLKKMKKGLIPDDSVVSSNGAASAALSFESEEFEGVSFDEESSNVVADVAADVEEFEAPEITVDEEDFDLS